MAAPIKDRFSNKAYGIVTESAANTLTFSEIQTNVSIFEKVAWVINRMEWYLSIATIGLLTAGNDMVQMALTASNNITDLDLENPAVIDMLQTSLFGYGTPATMINYTMPHVRDFSSLPGGGLIVAPRPLYVGIEAGGLATPGAAEVRISFQMVTLTPADYLELIDFYRIVQ